MMTRTTHPILILMPLTACLIPLPDEDAEAVDDDNEADTDDDADEAPQADDDGDDVDTVKLRDTQRCQRCKDKTRTVPCTDWGVRGTTFWLRRLGHGGCADVTSSKTFCKVCKPVIDTVCYCDACWVLLAQKVDRVSRRPPHAVGTAAYWQDRSGRFVLLPGGIPLYDGKDAASVARRRMSLPIHRRCASKNS